MTTYVTARRWGAEFWTQKDQTEWREKHGFVKKPAVLSRRKARKERKALKDKRPIWEMWKEQQLPITDPDALIYLATQMFEARRQSGYGISQWVILNEVGRLTQGTPVPEIVRKHFAAKFEGYDELRNKRHKAKERPTPGGLFVRLQEKTSRYGYSALDLAKFRNKNRKTQTVKMIPSNSPHRADLKVTTDKSGRRGSKVDHFELTIRSNWSRLIKPIANCLGEGTLVLDMVRGGAHPLYLVALQMQRVYAIRIRKGYITHNADGTATFTEV